MFQSMTDFLLLYDSFIKVDRDSEEWSDVAGRFKKTMKNSLQKVEKIENEELKSGFKWLVDG